ncbi:MAG: F0F1 ATP synthase subunit delta [Epsilonproteobacteria bacterium]|nr:F0F1 ATP synthase subunit delta [Campylobacterota bacterium]
MSNLIAKKYVNALINSCNDKELNEFYKELSDLSLVYAEEKFMNIILSPDIKNIDKENFIISLVNDKSKKFVNFLRLLGENDRLELVPFICDELRYQVAVKNNKFSGTIMSDFKITKAKIKTLEESFSRKFNSAIKLEKSDEVYPGVKVEIDDLGVEVSFSLERLKVQMSEHILKAI